ncbi:MAG: hypothetical protein AMJ56_21005, partial [Anaerolineae bacterium SG8_19]
MPEEARSMPGQPGLTSKVKSPNKNKSVLICLLIFLVGFSTGYRARIRSINLVITDRLTLGFSS